MARPCLDRRAFLGITAAALAGVRNAAAAPAAPGTRPATGPSAPPYDDQRHTNELFREIPRRLTCKASSLAEFREWQAAFRTRLRDLLGVTNMTHEVRFEGRAERVETATLDGYTREKWYLWTEPSVPLPIWVLIPERPAARPYPLVLTPHGHNAPENYLGIAFDEKQKAGIRDGERDIAVQAVREGYLCILPTARGFGETMRLDDRQAKKISSCRTANMHAMLFGRTMIGCRVWDISRILDWAMGRYEIDRRRIAITGNSGGGTTSVFAPACDERITVAVPSCYFCTFAASIGSIYHCECNYVPGLLREAEMYDVAGLIAPRPFRAIAGKEDAIFPIAAVRESFAKLKTIYRLAGAEDRCELYEGDGPHRYYRAGSWPFVSKWFERLGNA